MENKMLFLMFYQTHIQLQIQAQKAIEKDINVVNIEDMRNLIDRQDQVITKAGQMACTLVSHPQKMARVQ